MKFPSVRMTYALGLLAISIMWGSVVFLQYFENFNPCPLCLMQRFALVLLGITFVLGASFKFKKIGQIGLSLLSLLFALLGLLLAGRQVWLQYFPHDKSSDCGASLDYMLQAYPFTQVLEKVFTGTSDCSHLDWQFLHISLAGWSCLCFTGFALIAVWQLLRGFQK